MKTLKEEYKIEKGFDCWVEHPDYGSYTDDYVHWLEERLALILPVVKPVKEKERITFTKWTELNKYYEKNNVWFNESGNQRNYNDLLEMYLEEYPL